MAINFVTGLPRHGKTLWTLVHVKGRGEAENRAVYYCNIPQVSIPGWTEIKHPDEWLTLPDGALIVVDELQDFWGKSATGSRISTPILELSKHGKRGFDFYFITQEPNLVHSTPRDLCQHHYYVVRAAGTHNATVRKFDRICLHPDKQKKSAIETNLWRYPSEAFTWYKSADLHNVKRVIPRNVKLIPVVVLVLLAAIGGAVYSFKGFMDKAAGGKADKSLVAGAPGQPASAARSPVGVPGGQSAKPPMTPAEFVASFSPRVDGLQHTAPRYDSITQAKTAPYPAACIQMGKRCQCYSQQATKLPVPDGLCQIIVKDGYFNDWQQPQEARAPGQRDRLQGGNIPDYRPPGQDAATIREQQLADAAVWASMRPQSNFVPPLIARF